MDLGSAAISINPLAILAAAVVTFVLGGLWYSPLLFARPWMADNGIKEEEIRRRSPVPIFAGSFAGALLAAVVLAMFLGPSATLAFGVTAGFLVGFAWVAPAFLSTFLFEGRPLRLLLIDAGYHVVSFTLQGAILGAWR
jgi:hypothetical protein